MFHSAVILAMQFAVFDASNYAENVLHLAKAAQQIELAEQTLRKLRDPSWRSIASVVASGVAGQSASANIDGHFSSVFPGAVATRDYPTDDRARSRATLAALSGVLDAARASSSAVPPGAAQLDGFKPQVAASQGHEESLELANTVHIYSAQELTLLRQAIAAQTSAQAVYYAHQINATAESDESARALWSSMGAAPPRRALLSYADTH